jgi:tetratricopeptide (TPR) repeat protein
MVLPAPPPDDEVPPADAGWVEQIRTSLKLAGAKGILVHVDRAVPERLGDLVRGLCGDFPDLDVHADLGALETAPEGSTLVLIPRPEDADALNLGRPLFSRRNLKVVLWCDHETTVALAQNAPDFFDWISEHHDCPPGAVPHAVAGLKAACAAGAPGIVWRGPGDQEDKRRLLAAFETAFPGETLAWVDPRRDYEELLGAVRQRKDEWIACRAQAVSHVRRLRWAMADERKRGRAIIVTETGPCPGWWPVHGRLMPFAEARDTLEAAGSRTPGALAAMMGLEPEAVGLSRTLLRKSKNAKSLHEWLRSAPDPGVAVAKAARAAKLVRLSVALALPPVLRAYAATPRRLRVAFATEMNRGDALRLIAGELELLTDVEATLLLARNDESLIDLARRALSAGEVDVAGVWTMRLKDSPILKDESFVRKDDVLALSQWLIVRGDRRGAKVRDGLRSNPLIPFLVVLTCAIAMLGEQVRELTGSWFVYVFPPLLLLGPVLLVTIVYLKERGKDGALRRAREETTMAAAKLEARLLDVSLLLRRGEYQQATRALDIVIANRLDTLTEEHPGIRRADLLLACALVEQAEDDRARAVLEHAVAVEGRVSGVETPLFTALAISLSALLSRIGRARDAEEILRKLLGPDAPPPLPSEAQSEPRTYTLAQGGNAEADEYLQLLLALPKPPILSDEQRVEARLLLAEAWITQGRYDEAERLLEGAIGQADAVLAPDHMERWRTLTAYGRILFLQRRPAEAEPVLRRALDLAEKHAGEQHPDTARILTELARVEHGLGRPGASASARRALAIYEGAQLSDAAKALARAELGPIAG